MSIAPIDPGHGDRAAPPDDGHAHGGPSRSTQRRERALGLLRRLSLPALRIALGVIFIWFGILKIAGATPVAYVIESIVPFIDPPPWLVPSLGVMEALMGLGLLLGRGLRVVLPLFFAHMLGTMSVLVLAPEIAFQNGNPLMLTMEGEFVAKNVVLLAAGLAVATGSSRSRQPRGAREPAGATPRHR